MATASRTYPRGAPARTPIMGDESRRPQDGSFVDAIERRRLAPRGLVSRRQKDSASRRVFDQRVVFVARGRGDRTEIGTDAPPRHGEGLVRRSAIQQRRQGNL